MGRRRKARGSDTPSAIVVIDKPTGMSSFAVVRRVRELLGVARAGHTGTLDPLATGVLPICLNEATKIAGLLLADDKTYLAEVELGWRTDTRDREGAVIERGHAVTDRSQVEAVLDRLRGRIKQRPPAFSALKKDGRRAYELARQGVEVELAEREVTIHALNMVCWAPPRFSIEVHCSKGTYIRSLVDDLGQTLGGGAVLTELRRTASGQFSLSNAVTLDALAAGGRERLISLSEALAHLPAAVVEPEAAQRFAMGQALAHEGADAVEARVVLEGVVIGLGAIGGGQLCPRRVFPSLVRQLLGEAAPACSGSETPTACGPALPLECLSPGAAPGGMSEGD